MFLLVKQIRYADKQLDSIHCTFFLYIFLLRVNNLVFCIYYIHFNVKFLPSCIEQNVSKIKLEIILNTLCQLMLLRLSKQLFQWHAYVRTVSANKYREASLMSWFKNGLFLHIITLLYNKVILIITQSYICLLLFFKTYCALGEMIPPPSPTFTWKKSQ